MLLLLLLLLLFGEKRGVDLSDQPVEELGVERPSNCVARCQGFDFAFWNRQGLQPSFDLAKTQRISERPSEEVSAGGGSRLYQQVAVGIERKYTETGVGGWKMSREIVWGV